MGYYDADGAYVYEETDLADEGTGFSEVLNRGTRAVPQLVQNRVVAELADDTTIRAGAAEAVQAEVDELDVVLSTDPIVFDQVDSDAWALYFPASSPDGERVALGIDLNGNTRGRIMSSIAAPLSDVAAIEVWDSVHEWWTNNVVNRIQPTSGLEDRGCGVSGSGEVLAWDASKRGGRLARVIGHAGVTGPGGEIDDHDAPSRWTADDGSWGVQWWNNHGDTDYHSVKISHDGTAAGFTGPQHDVTVAPGAAVSYQQVFEHHASGDATTFWVLARTGPGWLIVEHDVNRTADTVTKGATLRRLITVGGQQTYCSAVQVGRTLRIAAYCNPKEDTHAIWLLHLNMDTNVLTCPTQPNLAHNVITGGYLDLLGVTPLVAETPTTQTSRRLYEPSPVADAVLYSEWARSDPDGGHYREALWTGTTTDVRVIPGGVTGPRIGYTADSNYSGGAAYSLSGKIATIHHDTTFAGSVLRVWDGTTSRIVAYSHRRMVRPVWLDDNEILVGDIEIYTDYFDYRIHQRSIRA